MLDIEDKVWTILMEPMHVYLLIGVFSIIMLLKWMGPVDEFLFKKYKYLIAPLNVILSSIGVFILKLTSAETIGLKIVIALLISTVVTFTYEALAKPIIDKIRSKLEARLESKTNLTG